MDIDKVFGLPAHPLLVHIPVVFIPLLGLWVIALAIKPQWRDRFATPTAIFGLGLMVMTILTAGAGEKLEARLGHTDLIEKHAELGDQTKVIMIVFALVLVALAIAVRRNMAKLLTPIVLLAAVAGIVATVWTVRTGHAGAKATWQEVGNIAPKAEGD